MLRLKMLMFVILKLLISINTTLMAWIQMNLKLFITVKRSVKSTLRQVQSGLWDRLNTTMI